MWQRIGSFLLLTHKGSAERYWEIDGLRGLAILLMVSYHFVFDLTLFGICRADVLTGVWRAYGRTSAVLFLVLAGVSLAIGHERSVSQATARHVGCAHLTRGLKLLGWGIVISLVIWAYTGQPAIIFGILHLIGTATILAYPFLGHRPALSAGSGAAIIMAGVILNPLPVAHPWLMWLGLRPPGLYQLDYFPVLPWFGVVLLGVAAGTFLYPHGVRRFTVPEWGSSLAARQAAWLGRRSLGIYLVHQPVLVGLLALIRAAG